MKTKEFYDALVAAGHLLQLDEDGNIDTFAMAYDFHNGPICELCHESWCEHCQGTISPCTSSVIDSTCEVVCECKGIGHD